MDTQRIEAHIKHLLAEAHKLEYELARYHGAWDRWRSDKESGTPPDSEIEGEDFIEKPFQSVALSLYLSTICLLDGTGLHEFLKKFYQTFGEHFDSKKASAEYDFDEHALHRSDNLFLRELRRFLAPLGLSDDATSFLKQSGIQYLDRILRGTATIVYRAGVIPDGEVEVYQTVRPVLEAIFPSSIGPKSNYMKTAKEYKPDILIPELGAVVEYKFAREEQKLKTTLAQICEDVKGYTDDGQYQIYYAVFYMETPFCAYRPMTDTIPE